MVIDPAMAAKILEKLSGAELALTILVAATGVRISEALGLKWEDVDYENQQIFLRRVWVNDTVVNRLKTDDSEAPVPLTDLLSECLRAWQAETTYGQPTDWVFASTKSKGTDAEVRQRSHLQTISGLLPLRLGSNFNRDSDSGSTTSVTAWRVGW